MRRRLLIVGGVACCLVLAAVGWARGEGPGAPAASRTFDNAEFPFTFRYPAVLLAEGSSSPQGPADREPRPGRLEPPGGQRGLILIRRYADQPLSVRQLVARDRQAHRRLQRMARQGRAPDPGRFQAARAQRHSGIAMLADETGYLEGDWTLSPDWGRRYRFALAGRTWELRCGALGRSRRLIREACERIRDSIRPR